MEIKLAKIFKTLVLIIFTNSLFTSSYSQEKFTRYTTQELKKKDGKWGVLLKNRQQWGIEPVYDKIEQYNFKLLAWKGDSLDVYQQYYLNPMIKNITIHDTSVLSSIAKNGDIHNMPMLYKKDNRWGWKYHALFKDTLVPPIYDSVVLIDTYLFKVYQKGMVGITTVDGIISVPPGNYADIYYADCPDIIDNGGHITGLRINYDNSDIRDFYYFKRPTGEYVCYFESKQGRNIIKPNEDFAQKFHLLIVAHEAANLQYNNWLSGLKIFAKNGAIGIKEDNGKTVLPATATAFRIGNVYMQLDNDSIKISMEEIGYQLTFKDSVSILFDSRFNKSINLKWLKENGIKAELNPYNSLAANYRLYFDVLIDSGFNYRSNITLKSDNCPICEGKGLIDDGYDYGSYTYSYDRVVKDGSTTITRKNYLSNERVTADGRVYIPTSTETITNYKVVRKEVKVSTETKKFKTCTLCNGKKKFISGKMIWDDARNEYVLTTLIF